MKFKLLALLSLMASCSQDTYNRGYVISKTQIEQEAESSPSLDLEEEELLDDEF